MYSTPIAARRWRTLAGVALLFIAAAPAQALTYLVGAGGGTCDYSTIQAAINGAASNPGPDSIRVARDQTYTAQQLTIGTQDLIIVGGYASCAAALPDSALPSGVTVVSGQGGNSAPVITITGSGVRDLRNLGVQRGDQVSNAGGGGIRFEGRGDLILRELVISNNQAGVGGGVSFVGDGSGPAVLTIEAGTLVTGNTALDSGGGVQIGGEARMFMLRDRSSIQGNQALGQLGLGGLGGGLLVVAPALVDIGSPGYNGLAALDGNTALRGGGLAAITIDDGDVDVGARLFSTDPARPVRVRNNRASVAGGGFFLRPNRCGFFSCDGSARLFVFTAQVDGNRAPDGAAIFGDYADPTLSIPLGSYVVVGRCPADALGFSCTEQAGFPEAIAAFGGLKKCAAGSPGCNSVDNNLNVDANNVETDGATIRATEGAVFMTGMTIAGNTGGNVFGGYTGLVAIFGSQLILNSLSSDLVRADGVAIVDSTIAGNVLGGATHVIRMGTAGNFVMKSSVLWQPGKLTLIYPGVPDDVTLFEIRYNVLSDNTTTPGLANRQVDPRFNFPPSGDFRLRISSPALDYAPPVIGTDLDLDGRPYDQQVRPGPQRELVRDAGAFERQLSDPLLLNGRFDGSALAWQNNLPAFAIYSPLDAAGNPASGSVEVNVPAASIPAGASRMTALTQCFGVPWPGIFRINAKAQTKVTELVPFPDNVAVHWKLRAASLDCTGPIVSEGDRVLPNGSTGWLTAATPAEVLVADSLWNSQTSIEVQIDLLQNGGSPVASGLFGRVDDIVMTYADPVDLFKNGFE